MTDDRDTGPRRGPDGGEYARLVEFHRARTPWEARVVQAVLAEAGIQAYVPGGMLTDEFAMSQQLLNLQGVTVLVPRNQLEAAAAALAAARQAGAELSEEEDDEGAEDDAAGPAAD